MSFVLVCDTLMAPPPATGAFNPSSCAMVPVVDASSSAVAINYSIAAGYFSGGVSVVLFFFCFGRAIGSILHLIRRA